MGRDKGLIPGEENGIPFVKNTYNLVHSTLANFNKPDQRSTEENTGSPKESKSETQASVYVSVSVQNRKLYESLFPSGAFIEDVIHEIGPVGGLISAHRAHPHQDFLVLACDMFRMNRAYLNRLLEIYQSAYDESWDAYIFLYQGKREGLAGIYTSRYLKSIHELFRENKMKNYSIRFLLESAKVRDVNITEDSGVFKNANRPEDLE